MSMVETASDVRPLLFPYLCSVKSKGRDREIEKAQTLLARDENIAKLMSSVMLYSDYQSFPYFTSASTSPRTVSIASS